jgi:hypothetical protein
MAERHYVLCVGNISKYDGCDYSPLSLSIVPSPGWPGWCDARHGGASHVGAMCKFEGTTAGWRPLSWPGQPLISRLACLGREWALFILDAVLGPWLGTWLPSECGVKPSWDLCKRRLCWGPWVPGPVRGTSFPCHAYIYFISFLFLTKISFIYKYC